MNVLHLESISRIDSKALGGSLQNSEPADPHFVIAAPDRAKDGLTRAVTERIRNHVLAAIQQLNSKRSTDRTIILETDFDSQLDV